MAATSEKPTLHEAPPAPVANLGWLLSQASHVLNTHLVAALEEIGISPRAFCLINTAMTGEYTQTELAGAVGLDKTTMTVTLDDLEAKGLVERLPSSTDRRARVIAVTKEGRRKAAQGEAIVDRVHRDVLSSLPAKERTALVDGLQQLVCESLSTVAECAQKPRRRRT